SLRLAERQHLAFFFAVEKIVVILHRNEWGPAVLSRQILRFGKLPRIHRRGADVTGFPCLDHIMQRLERFFYWCVFVPAMNLVEVDVVSAEPAEAGIDFSHN